MARGDHMYLLDLWRERVSYPELKRALLRLRERYPTAALVIENKGSGMSLMEDLRAQNVASIRFNPDGDKQTRLAAVSVQFESGAVLFPKEAPWLDALKAELLGFPNLKQSSPGLTLPCAHSHARAREKSLKNFLWKCLNAFYPKSVNGATGC
jgi:predicted phage terminase large subunit-like protein